MKYAEHNVENLPRTVTDAEGHAIVLRQDPQVIVDKGGAKCRDKEYVWLRTQNSFRAK